MAEPHMKVSKVLNPVPGGAESKKSDIIAGDSPANTISGRRIMALYRLVYQDKCKALPLTTSKLRLITTEWQAVIIELKTPKVIPIVETSVPSRKTPMKNPQVTKKQARRILRDGRELSITKDVPTVNGRTMPLAI